jgi:mRNA interferase MazF
MKTRELKVARIGNSRGVRLPAAALKRYSVGAAVIMEERAEGILLRPKGPVLEKLSWEETAREMAAAGEDWGEWDALDADGLDSVPWDTPKGGRIKEGRARYGPKTRAREGLFRRYDVRWASLGPSRGAEMAKTRPVVIVSLDELNARLQTVTICPITSRLHPAWRSRLPVRCAGQPAEIAVDQIRTVTKTRLGPRIGALTDDEASMLRKLITEMFGE